MVKSAEQLPSPASTDGMECGSGVCDAAKRTNRNKVRRIFISGSIIEPVPRGHAGNACAGGAPTPHRGKDLWNVGFIGTVTNVHCWSTKVPHIIFDTPPIQRRINGILHA